MVLTYFHATNTQGRRHVLVHTTQSLVTENLGNSWREFFQIWQNYHLVLSDELMIFWCPEVKGQGETDFEFIQ